MKNSVEMRLPFLDHEIWEKVFSMDENLIYSTTFSNYKMTLRNIISKYFPKYKFKKKEGFNGPVFDWINNNKFKKKISNIKSRTLKKYLSSYEINRIINQKKVSQSDCQLLFSILIIDNWLIKNEK
jgi:asparagine synthase (glutamine-hydrolysing)